MLMGTSWQCLTTCLCTTTPSTGGGRGDSTPRKVGSLCEEQHANGCKSIITHSSTSVCFQKGRRAKGELQNLRGFREGRGRQTDSAACKIRSSLHLRDCPPPHLLINLYCKDEKHKNTKYFLNFRLRIQLG